VTYIFLLPLIAAVNLAPQSGSAGEKGDWKDPRKRTIFIGTIALGSLVKTSLEEGFKRSYFDEEDI
jgi:hypothetical protein